MIPEPFSSLYLNKQYLDNATGCLKKFKQKTIMQVHKEWHFTD